MANLGHDFEPTRTRAENAPNWPCDLNVDMCYAWLHHLYMSMIQIRNVPEDVHRQLKARAALAGMSVSEFLLAEARRSLERPTRGELLARIAERSRTQLSESPVDALGKERQE